MKKRVDRMINPSVWICLVSTAFSCGAQHIPDGAYLGQTPPGNTPEIFAPDLVSLPERRDTKIVFSPDGSECFIGTVVDNRFTLLYTSRESGHWSDLVGSDFLGAADKREPFISPDGLTLFFVRNADIWISKKQDGEWSDPEKLSGPISTGAEEWHPTVTDDGTLYFCSTRDGSYNIYRARPVDGQYPEAEKLDTMVNTQYEAWDPFIAADESYMIFSTSRPDGYGRVDQHVTYYDSVDGSWSQPRNLGASINTGQIEYGAYVSPDNRHFFFSRPAGWGASVPADIYWVSTEAVFRDTASNVEYGAFSTDEFCLGPNYPNPFNPATTIRYVLDRSASVKLTVHNVKGQLVRTLLNSSQSAGAHLTAWDGRDSSGQSAGSGVYLYRLEMNGQMMQRKMMLMK